MNRDANTGGPLDDDPRAASRPVEPGSVHVLIGGRRTRVVLTGEIDAELSPDLLEAAAEAQETGQPIEVDAQHVTFMDSTGVAFLARLSTRSPERLLLIRPPDAVRFLVDVTSISELVTILDDDPGFDATLPGAPTGGGPDLIA